jgi:hypothetical protein
MDMDHDAVQAVAGDMNTLAQVLTGVQGYALGDGLTAQHFGDSQPGSMAFTAFNSAVQALGASVSKAQKFCADASALLSSSAKATKSTDVDNAWGLNKAGGK